MDNRTIICLYISANADSFFFLGLDLRIHLFPVNSTQFYVMRYILLLFSSYNSLFINSRRLFTLVFASSTSCLSKTGPTSLYTLVSSSSRSSSFLTISFSLAC
ncbi:hypothetical protein PsorP6_011644 [Peronosclerospora sorghi]|uniref:Uncharacterized protein n=1 Tax=Peronosclerospora sorghi TaxID=230839 RepID=A0ACC0WIC9_9STRA|nr:hypothetical protein PsorP6_011644 [Peronosclerospora sorghi]